MVVQILSNHFPMKPTSDHKIFLDTHCTNLDSLQTLLYCPRIFLYLCCRCQWSNNIENFCAFPVQRTPMHG
eukprot:Gb_24279 [translate_table: standard]